MPQNTALKAAKRTLLVLTFINLFNYLDRYVVSALVEPLKASGLGLGDDQIGWVMGSFVLVYLVASPFFGTLGDRASRPRLIAAGVLIWSVATSLGGFATGFVSLLLARALVGIGEAAYGAIAPAMLADAFPAEQRGRVFSNFFCAIPVGSALGFVLGGWVNAHYGWRQAFMVAGVPGLILGLLALKLKDPARGGQDKPTTQGPAQGLAAYRALLGNLPYMLTLLGYAAYTFGLGGLASWMPAFLSRVRGVPNLTATVNFGAIVVVTGFVGTFIGGRLGDHFLKRTPRSYLYVSAGATALAVPFAALALISTDPAVYWTGIIAAELFLFASTGPINSMIVNLVHPLQRATAVGMCNFAIHLLGDVPSPILIGTISTRSSLERAILMVPVSIAVGAVIWGAAALAQRLPGQGGSHAQGA